MSLRLLPPSATDVESDSSDYLSTPVDEPYHCVASYPHSQLHQRSLCSSSSEYPFLMSGGLASSATARTSSLVPPHANSFRQGLPLDGSDTSSYIRQNCLHMSASLDDHLFVQDDWSLPCGPPCGEEGHAATPLIQRSFQGESYDRQSPLDSGIAESSLGATAFVSASQYFQDSQDFHDYSHESSAVLPHHPLTAHAPTPFSISLHQPFVEYGGRPQDGCRAADSNDGETCSHYGTEITSLLSHSLPSNNDDFLAHDCIEDRNCSHLEDCENRPHHIHTSHYRRGVGCPDTVATDSTWNMDKSPRSDVERAEAHHSALAHCVLPPDLRGEPSHFIQPRLEETFKLRNSPPCPYVYPRFNNVPSIPVLPHSDLFHGHIHAPQPHTGRVMPIDNAGYIDEDEDDMPPPALVPTYRVLSIPVAPLVPEPRPPSLVEDSPKKPLTLACFFCRKRKIACGSPPPGSKDRTCK
ncbi:hypothetical protein AcV7_003881 [Taiwanofungus camphoratus]|nr:hypothetical protein AcV7_003881 [Antrodia cinnamomea]